MADTTLNVVTLEGVKLNLSTGDTLAIMHPLTLTKEQRERIQVACAAATPEGFKVIVLDGWITISAISAKA